jgi:hypothetical protein
MSAYLRLDRCPLTAAGMSQLGSAVRLMTDTFPWELLEFHRPDGSLLGAL